MTETGQVTVRGVTIAYDRAGEGPPLVLLHGIGANASAWRTQVDGLSDAFDVIAWDAPGYLPVAYATPGTAVTIQFFGTRHPATVAREPLYDPKNARMKTGESD